MNTNNDPQVPSGEPRPRPPGTLPEAVARGLVRLMARRLDASPSADELDRVISVWVDDLEATGIGDVRAVEVAQAIERCGRTAKRWPHVQDVIALLPARERTPEPDPGWPPNLPRPPEWCDFTRHRGESQGAYNLRMLAQAREVLAAGNGPLARSASFGLPEREPGCDDEPDEYTHDRH